MTMDSWRLSCIEEELERLDLVEDADLEYPQTDEELDTDVTDLPLPPPPPGLLGPAIIQEEDIYSKAVLGGMDTPDPAKEATRFITEKYDSLGRLRLPPSLSSVPEPRLGAPPPLPPVPAPKLTLDIRPPSPPSQRHTPPGVNPRIQPWLEQQQQIHQQKMQQQQLHQQKIQQQQIQQQQAAQQQQMYQHQQQYHHQQQQQKRQSEISAPNPPVGNAVNMHATSPPGVTMRPRTGAGANPASRTGRLTEQDLVQVEMFFRSHKTEVMVGQSMASLYFGAIGPGSPTRDGPNPRPQTWSYVKSGIPVIVLDSGESRRYRRLNIVLAEHGTGFVLWKESMTHLSQYTGTHPTFHTMHLSTDHTKLAGFSFDDAAAAAQFLHKINTITSDPEDVMLNLSGKHKKRKDKNKSKSKQKYKAPTKLDISTPCCFTHITKLDRSDGMSMLTMPIMPPGCGESAARDPSTRQSMPLPTSLPCSPARERDSLPIAPHSGTLPRNMAARSWPSPCQY